MEDKKNRDVFSSRIGMILSTVGFAVGVGNLWRFPYITGTYGGGTFLLFYFIVLFLIGIPLLTAEISLGVATRSTPVGAYEKISPKSKWHLNGYVHMLAITLIAGYTMPVGGWILHYLFRSSTGYFNTMSAGQIGVYFDEFIANGPQVLLLAYLVLLLILIIVPRGLQKGLEKVSTVLLPALFVIMIIISIKGLTLPNSIEGLKFYLTPDFSKFTLEGASAAVSQMFYSVGIGMAASLIFGSYLPDNQREGIAKNAVQISLTDTGVAILAGFMIFPTLFSFGLEPGQGPGLVFVTMPNVFNSMGGGQIWGTLFYICFFIAAFTSFVSGAEAVIGFIVDQFNYTRKKAMVVYVILMLIIVTPSALSMDIFNKIDFFENGIVLPLAALIMSIFVSRIWGMENFFEIAGIKSELLKKYMTFSIKYLCPLIIIFLALISLGILKI